MTTLIAIARRLGSLAAVLVLVSFLVFSLLALGPGSPEQTLLGPQGVSDPQAVQAIREEYDLDKPPLSRYGNWMADALQLDFGRSTQSGEPVARVLSDRAPLTLKLSAMALVIALALGVPAGIASATRRGGTMDRAISAVAVVASSVPPFALGILLISIFGVRLGWFPPVGPGTGGLSQLQHLVLPSITLAAMMVAVVVRQTRAAALEVVMQDYVVFARARGLGRREIVMHYMIRNSALPIVTSGGLLLVLSLSGAVLVETVFALPGLGSLIVDAVANQNVPILQGTTLLVAALIVTINLCTDLFVLAVDPRTRSSEATSA